MGTFEHVAIERRGNVGWLILDRPESANAINTGMRNELPHAWAQLDDDSEVRVVVITGRGRAFCAGADVKEIAADSRGMGIHEEVIRSRLTLTAMHNDVWKPVISAVNGICAGGGLHFIVDSDIIVASSNATFMDPHVSVGQVSAYEPIGLRPRMPFGAIARLAFVGVHERLNARDAHDLGLVDIVVEDPADLADRVQELAATIARNSPAALVATKRALWASLDHGMADGVAHGAEILLDFWGHPDNDEGPAAFAEKRDPQWAPGTPTRGYGGRNAQGA